MNVDILSTERDLYSRQKGLPVVIPKRAMVFGAGGIGTWVAIFLAMSGVEKLTIWDDDVLEESNRARLPYRAEDVGRGKTELLRNILEAMRPEIDLTLLQVATEEVLGSMPAQVDVVFDCTDTSKARAAISKWCGRNNLPYIKTGYNGLEFTVTSAKSSFSTGVGEDTGYTVTPSWVVPAAMAALIAVMKRCCGLEQNWYGDIRQLVNKEGMSEHQ